MTPRKKEAIEKEAQLSDELEEFQLIELEKKREDRDISKNEKLFLLLKEILFKMEKKKKKKIYFVANENKTKFYRASL